jgi:hypothetical protein
VTTVVGLGVAVGEGVGVGVSVGVAVGVAVDVGVGVGVGVGVSVGTTVAMVAGSSPWMLTTSVVDCCAGRLLAVTHSSPVRSSVTLISATPSVVVRV